MSYCRWSSDDFQCDVYVYENISGYFTIHVAGNRHVLTEKLPEPILMRSENMEAFFDRKKAVDKILESSDRQDIGLSRDGETFDLSTADECADMLEDLRNEGYNVPQYAIDGLREEVEQPNR